MYSCWIINIVDNENKDKKLEGIRISKNYY